jgi:hypothetical protein
VRPRYLIVWDFKVEELKRIDEDDCKFKNEDRVAKDHQDVERALQAEGQGLHNYEDVDEDGHL